MINKSFFYRFFWILASVIAVLYTSNMYLEVLKLEQEGGAVELEVVKKSCRRRGGSFIGVDYREKHYVIAYLREKCYSTNIGDTVSLIYSQKGDFFYEPGRSELHRKHIYLAVISLLASVMPWSRIQKYFTN